jgi:hypothetical protein
VIGLGIMQLVLWTSSWYTLLLVVFVFPFPILYNFIAQVENEGVGYSLKRMRFLASQNYGRILGLFILLLLLCLFFFLIVDSSLIEFFFRYISWVIYLDQGAMDQLSVVVLTFVSVYVLHLLYMLVISGISIQYFTLREIKEADHLREKIQHMGSGKMIQGLERE